MVGGTVGCSAVRGIKNCEMLYYTVGLYMNNMCVGRTIISKKKATRKYIKYQNIKRFVLLEK